MKLRRIIALILALVLLLGLVAGAISVSAEELETPEKEAWEGNLLVDDPISVFAIDKECILSVTFLDTLEDVPEIHWNMGKNHLEDVQAWIEWQPQGGNVYFAAEGGINGKDSAKALFKGMGGLKEVKFNGAYHTEQAESLAEMFRDCFRLETVDAENLKTDSAESFYCMFTKCRKLKELDLSSWNTEKVTNMGHMFEMCKKLEKVNVANWNTAKVTNMEGMFGTCFDLEEPDFTGWNVEAVTNYNYFMDWGCKINDQAWWKFFK